MKKHTLRKIFASTMAAAMLLSAVPAAFAAEHGETHITIIGTSDMHGNIWGYSYEDMVETDNNGMARVSTYVKQVRSENPNTILVDAGDTIQGTIMTDDLYSKSSPDHPVMAAMNYMGYDAWVLGNHEFNWGVANLKAIMAQSDAPVLAANIKNADGSLFTDAAYTIVDRGGVKVAIIGVDTPNIPKWDGTKDGIEDLVFISMADAVDEAIDEIGNKADVIMVSAHAGLGIEFADQNGADSAQVILDKNPEVDVLQLGHLHVTVVEKQGDVVIGGVQGSASEVNRFDLTLDKDKNIVDATVEVVSMDGVAPDQALRELPEVKTAQEKTVSFIQDDILGHTTAKFQPENEIRGLPEGKLRDTAVMDLILTVQLENSGADVTGAALFKEDSDLPQGDINYGNIFDIYKFPNVLYTVEVTGAELKAYMEWSADCYNQWKPGDINISFNPEKPDFLYDMFAGVDYEIDLSQPSGSRIKNVTFQGKPVTDDQILKLCVNDYRYTGLKDEGIISGDKIAETSASVRDMLVAYLAEHDPLAPVVDNNWGIVGVDLGKDDPRRQELVDLINEGKLESPYYKSYNLADYDKLLTQASTAQASAVTVNGVAKDVATATDANGETYYRLRDLAFALKGTAAQFQVEWNGQVVVTTGTAYTGAALAMPNSVQSGDEFSLNLLLDGTPVTLPAVLVNGNHYLDSSSLVNLGVESTMSGGTLIITTK